MKHLSFPVGENSFRNEIVSKCISRSLTHQARDASWSAFKTSVVGRRSPPVAISREFCVSAASNIGTAHLNAPRLRRHWNARSLQDPAA